jgi:hypothetical protein
VQWTSGAVDELTVARRRSIRTPPEAVDRIRELAALGMQDESLAAQLNDEKLATGTHHPWTTNTVKKVRLQHSSIRRAPNRDARQTLPDRHPDGRYSVRGAMKRFGVNSDKVRRWIKRGMVDAVREDFEWCYGAWWLSIDEATAKRLEQDATKRRRANNAGVTGRR